MHLGLVSSSDLNSATSPPALLPAATGVAASCNGGNIGGLGEVAREDEPSNTVMSNNRHNILQNCSTDLPDLRHFASLSLNVLCIIAIISIYSHHIPLILIRMSYIDKERERERERVSELRHA